ncbi:hypothetical protein EAI_00428 [Harpegnathos saltator]|uniref:Uncharacterized protein n=1 Tax=Harpegnathos saltator TaxID=610380 RepID=E2BK78_HARSA|nr:hypothetical protein EAI_00428 [Harpegnathos saltator]
MHNSPLFCGLRNWSTVRYKGNKRRRELVMRLCCFRAKSEQVYRGIRKDINIDTVIDSTAKLRITLEWLSKLRYYVATSVAHREKKGIVPAKNGKVTPETKERARRKNSRNGTRKLHYVMKLSCCFVEQNQKCGRATFASRLAEKQEELLPGTFQSTEKRQEQDRANRLKKVGEERWRANARIGADTKALFFAGQNANAAWSLLFFYASNKAASDIIGAREKEDERKKRERSIQRIIKGPTIGKTRFNASSIVQKND